MDKNYDNETTEKIRRAGDRAFEKHREALAKLAAIDSGEAK